MPTRLLAVAASCLALSTVVSAAPGIVAQPGTPAAAPVTGRILFAGTEHRSLGVVHDQWTSKPLLGQGPAHFDDQPSAVGKELVFTSRRDAATPQVYLRDAEGQVRRLTTGRDAGHPRLSPNGALVVFDSAEAAPIVGPTQRDLWVVGRDGSGLRRLTMSPENESEPTLSPDGTEIAYTSDDGGTANVFRQPLAGGPAVRLTVAGGSQPAWNPVRANLIAYTQGSGDTRRLRMIDGSTPGNPILTSPAEDVPSFSPAWQPNGDTLLFVSLFDGVDQVFQVDCTCSPDPYLLLNEDRGADSPTWLDGQLVVARSTAPDRTTADLQDVLPDGADPRDLGVSVLREDPGAVTNADLLFNPSPGFDPWLERQNYSPDGQRIAVTRFETVGGRRIERIWLTDADGSNAAPLALSDRRPGDWETDPAWSPDGRFLVFARLSPGGVGNAGAPSRVFIADVATGQVTGALPPSADPPLSDAQPEWSSDGDTITFTRVANIGGSRANKHIWLTSATDLGRQRDLTAAVCGADCPVIDDSPAFSPDGTKVAFNRKDDAVLLVSVDGTGCRVLLPAGPNTCAGRIVAPTGPFQPRDVAFSPDGNRMVLTTRRAAVEASPEMLALLDIASGRLTPLDPMLPGRQKEPSWQRTVDLAVTAPPSVPTVAVNDTVTITATITNHGPAPSLDTTLTLTVPGELILGTLRPARGTCAVPARRCDLGTLAPGETVAVTAELLATAVGIHRLGWSVSGTLADSQPEDNTAVTLVPVELVLANPALSVAVTPTPGYVGGTVTVTYTASNGNAATATGLTLVIALPNGIPAGPPPGCTVTGCALPDLPPGASVVVRVPLVPNAAVQTTVSGTLRTTGTDSNPADNTAVAPLVVLQPKIIAVPPIGEPGFVTSVRGTDFPPGVPVTLTWTPGITASAVPVRPAPAGTFIAQLLILTKDQTGPRVITASGPGFSPVTTPFLVVLGTYGPPDLVVRR